MKKRTFRACPPSRKRRLSPIPARAPVAATAPQATGAAGGTVAVRTGGVPDLSYIAEDLRPLAVPIAEVAFLVDNPLDHDDDEIADMRDRLRKRSGATAGGELPAFAARGARRQQALRAMLAENWQYVAKVRVDLDDVDATQLAIELNVLQGEKWNNDLLVKAFRKFDKAVLGSAWRAF